MQILSPGTRIGQYEIASRPMMGGMGVVYFALHHGNDGRPVALKTFRPELLPDRAARDRFLREGTAWVELGSHPHIVRCYKVEYIDPTAFLVLELIAKEQNMLDASLRSWLIPGRPLPLEQALLFALQIARGMQYATEKIPGFVHRDLKPENILVGADRLPNININRLRVTDFGLAVILKDEIGKIKDEGVSEGASRTQLTHGAVGTPLYMAPEQWKGEPTGAFTDVYALGCILYEMITGQYAVVGKTISQLRDAHCGGKLQSRPESLPKDIDAFIIKCLAVDPNQRFENWGELTDVIEYIYLNQSGISVPFVMKSAELSREDRTQRGWSHIAIGQSYLHIGKTQVAISYFDRAYEIGKIEKEKKLESSGLFHTGTAYTVMGEAKQALLCYEQVLAIARESGNRFDEASALDTLGITYKNLGNVKQAIRFFEHALIIAQEINNRGLEGAVLNSLGLSYGILGDTQQSITYFQMHLEIARKSGDKRGEGAALGNLGIAYKNLGQIAKAIGYHEQYLIIARDIGDRAGEGKALANLGVAYLNLGDTKLASTYFQQQLEIAREIGDQHQEGMMLSNIGSIYLMENDIQQAIRHFENALELARKISDRDVEVLALSNLGNLYKKTQMTEQAIIYYEQALQIANEIDDAKSIATISFNFAQLYAKQDNVPKALSLAKKAFQIWSQIGSPNVQQAQTLVAQLQGDKVNSTDPALEAFTIFQTADSLEAVQAIIKQYPFMTEVDYIEIIEQIIDELIPPSGRSAFQQRLDWLKQLANK